MMSRKSKQELLDTVRPRYYKAGRKEKKRILDELVANTGYERKYIIQVLNHPAPPPVRRKRRGKSRYGLRVKAALIQIWRAANCICGKRLVAGMRDLIDALERHHELVLEDEIRDLLLHISPATVDRLLYSERDKKRHGLGTTKPGTLLKQSIPIRTFADWDEQRPGFFEADLVAHCGSSAAGAYLYTLVLVDVHTGWTECIALANKGQQTVKKALDAVRQRLPFPMLGLDSDNDAAFINATLARYCAQEQITFTRSRPSKKNDQAYVEQKNWTTVRQTVGYDRYEGRRALRSMQTLYQVLRLHTNFFQPVMKMTAKKRVGSKVTKQYDNIQTPFRRVLSLPEVLDAKKAQLQECYLALNPAALLRQIHELQEQLWRLAQK
ncbi:MAG: transposase family protein [Chloroflexi bacterium]|nr:transposase family protein [Chloroflexota bacterium]